MAKLVAEQLPQDSIKILDIRAIHALKIEELPFHHQDPFDRILIAQAICETLTIITSDRKFTMYSARLLEI